VLTGGSQRVENGLTLLAEGKAKKLFVSGVYRSTDVRALLRTNSQKPDWLTCCIELGHEADNTHGNAAETAAWMKAENFHSLRLVTASYHMPRSMLEFSRAMPGIRIVPNPVFPAGAVHSWWWLRPRAASLVVGEYMKYLFALTGLEALGPGP
ncbi:MAG: YdcF family protein, partial [Stellaceae bacterium]